MKDDIKIEEQFLLNTKELLNGLLQNHMKTQDCKFDAFTKAKIVALVSRMFQQELEYLYDDPQNYFEMYGKDHLKN